MAWWQSGDGRSVPWGPARRTLPLDVVLSESPFVFDDADGHGPTALIPLTLESYRRLVQPRIGGPDFDDPAALESWFLGRYQLTA